MELGQVPQRRERLSPWSFTHWLLLRSFPRFATCWRCPPKVRQAHIILFLLGFMELELEFLCFVILRCFQQCVSFKWTRVPAEEKLSAIITTPSRRSASFSATEVAREMTITSRASRSVRKPASESRVSTRRAQSVLHRPPSWRDDRYYTQAADFINSFAPFYGGVLWFFFGVFLDV